MTRGSVVHFSLMAERTLGGSASWDLWFLRSLRNTGQMCVCACAYVAVSSTDIPLNKIMTLWTAKPHSVLQLPNNQSRLGDSPR